MRAYFKKSVLPGTRARVRPGGGFTLVELLVVIAIIGILLVASVPIFSSNSNSARQSSREIVKAHLQQARSHAIATGIATAVVIPALGSGPEIGARSLGLIEVENPAGSFQPVRDETANRDRLLQRWEKLPGSFHFLGASQISAGQGTLTDGPETLDTSYLGTNVSCHFIVFSSTGQIVHPPAGPVYLALGQAVLQNGSLRVTERSQGGPVFDYLQINRLTGRARQAEPGQPTP